MVTSERTGVVVVTTSVGDEPAAAALASMVVGARIAACAQVAGPVLSTYRWKGEVEHSDEWVVTMKTSTVAVEELCARVRDTHRYEVPELVVVEVVGGDADYLAWVIDSTS